MRFYLILFGFLLLTVCLPAQSKTLFYSCRLVDSVESKLIFIQNNSSKIFTDTAECKQAILNHVVSLYISTKNKKYLNALTAIRLNPAAKVSDLYADVIIRLVQNDFTDFIQKLYLGKGKYAILEKELIFAMNMIVGNQPLKQKYFGTLNESIKKAAENKKTDELAYLKKLKVKIESEKH